MDKSDEATGGPCCCSRPSEEIELEHKFGNMGARMVREVAPKTIDTAGDGTTTATLLAQAIVHEGTKTVASGMNPIDEVRRSFDERALVGVATAAGAMRFIEAVPRHQIPFSMRILESCASYAGLSAGDARLLLHL